MPNIRVKFFANFREFTDTKELEMDGSTVIEILKNLCAKFPGFEELIFDGKKIKPYVNVFLKESGGITTMLHADDEIALFPPVSGG
jgi:molybdopterin synthase sulfur carrier subunit